MATRLQQIFEIDQGIQKRQDEIKALMKARETILAEAIKSGTMEDKRFVMKAETITGKRYLDIKLMQEKYPEVLKVVGKLSCTISDASTKLSGDDLDTVTGRYQTKIIYHVEKKASDIVEV